VGFCVHTTSCVVGAGHLSFSVVKQSGYVAKYSHLLMKYKKHLSYNSNSLYVIQGMVLRYLSWRHLYR